MKKLLSTIGLAGMLCFSASAQAPTYGSQTLGTFTNAPGAATNLAYVIDCRKQASVMLQLEQTGDGTNTTVNVAYLTKSVDGSTYDTAGRFLTFTPNGSTKAVAVTNITTDGAGYMKINYFTNGNGSTGITNGVWKYGIKISSP